MNRRDKGTRDQPWLWLLLLLTSRLVRDKQKHQGEENATLAQSIDGGTHSHCDGDR